MSPFVFEISSSKNVDFPMLMILHTQSRADFRQQIETKLNSRFGPLARVFKHLPSSPLSLKDFAVTQTAENDAFYSQQGFIWRVKDSLRM